MTKEEILATLEQKKDEKRAEGMRTYGVTGVIYGISMADLRLIAKKVKKNHALAMDLWNNEVHEAKLLATLTAEADLLTEKEIDSWVKDFDAWDLVDQSCMNLYRYSPKAIAKIPQFAENENEFIRRTAFSLIAVMCTNKSLTDEDFSQYLPLIEKYSSDERPMVHQSCDWALRSVGKRSERLKAEVLPIAHRLAQSENKYCRYVGTQAIKELEQKKKVSCVSLKQKDKTKKNK